MIALHLRVGMILQRNINDERKRSYHHFRTANHHFILITNKALNRLWRLRAFLYLLRNIFFQRVHPRFIVFADMDAVLCIFGIQFTILFI